MLKRIGQYLAELLDGSDSRTADSDRTFTGSMLDWSVNYAEGGGQSQAEGAKEIANLQEKSRVLEEEGKHRR